MSLLSTRSWSPSTWLGATSSQGAPSNNDEDVLNGDGGGCGDDGDGAKSLYTWLGATSPQGAPEDKDVDNGDDGDGNSKFCFLLCLHILRLSYPLLSSLELPPTTTA